MPLDLFQDDLPPLQNIVRSSPNHMPVWVGSDLVGYVDLDQERSLNPSASCWVVTESLEMDMFYGPDVMNRVPMVRPRSQVMDIVVRNLSMKVSDLDRMRRMDITLDTFMKDAQRAGLLVRHAHVDTYRNMEDMSQTFRIRAACLMPTMEQWEFLFDRPSVIPV